MNCPCGCCYSQFISSQSYRARRSRRLKRSVGKSSPLVPTAWESTGRVNPSNHLHRRNTLSPSLLGADIDTLLVAPRHVDRSEFFSSFIEMLQEEKSITNIRVSSSVTPHSLC